MPSAQKPAFSVQPPHLLSSFIVRPLNNPCLSRRPARPRTQCCVAAPQPAPAPADHVFIYGIGYVGLQFGLAMKKQGAKVSGTTRSLDRARRLQRLGIDAIAVDDYIPASTAAISHSLNSATHIISTLPPLASPNPFPALPTHAPWLCYLSSSSVYGDHSGRTVTELTPPSSPPATGLARLAAEATAASLGPVCVLRLAGIYGPGRSAVDTLLARPVAVTTATKLTSRIHVRDIVAAMLLATAARAEGVFNIADDEPATRSEVFDFARRTLRDGEAGKDCQERLTYLEALEVGERPPSRRDRDRVSKRVGNARMKEVLEVKLLFPSYREGLRAIASEYAAASMKET